MNIILFTHPCYSSSQSMPRFANMLNDGMKKRGHNIEIWSPKSFFYDLPFGSSVKKWLGYIDQYIIFQLLIRYRLKYCSHDTIFVFADQALGPWIPIVANRKHIIHCHDFLAQRSALGQIVQNHTGWSGRLYQSYIRNGYTSGKFFISVSKQTQCDLHKFLTSKPLLSKVVYNGLNNNFKQIDVNYAREILEKELKIKLGNGFLLHVGGNQWYKNRKGVIQIYDAYCESYGNNIPLLMIGVSPSISLMEVYEQSPNKGNIYMLSDKSDEFVKLAYSAASLFLFPSLAEGFGWPIAEAMASGCPVITTNEAPMTEVAGNAAFLIEKMPISVKDIKRWALQVATLANNILTMEAYDRNELINKGFENIKRFNTEASIAEIEKIYHEVLLNENF